MKKILILSLLIFTTVVFGQTKKDNLTEKIEKILKDKKANVGVSIVEKNNKKIVDIKGNDFFPMLSTVKFPIALTILDKVQKNELSLSQKIFIKKEELLENPDNWSPFKEKYPNGNVEITLEEALSWMVSYSDNNLTDILLRLIGGPETVQNFIDSKNFIIKNDEEDMHKDWESQFINKITPNEATKLLSKFLQWENFEYIHYKKALQCDA
ncbi:Extended-spectrum beta-lactamase PER-1 precursor [Algoriella xinjiangensis]|uniref:class A beta-lactamase-related serine hydrolase n=1 Tax=Algoriella xinjiangensis TaxID=684065 RepID=UPI000FB47746|nr:class A beta-lactamase-related serine hydrolase [Algoriella xinjiangensis]VDH15454.1 Extended-spectrum beta-lactamase PER-1 precursor [Algoriella xinjiangensis]